MGQDIEELIDCTCGSLLCVVKFQVFEDDNSDEAYISFIIKSKGFWQRIKFLFKGTHEEGTVTTRARLKEIANKL